MNYIKVGIISISLSLFIFILSIGYSNFLIQVLENNQTMQDTEMLYSTQEKKTEQWQYLFYSLEQSLNALSMQIQQINLKREQIGKAQLIVDATYNILSPGANLCAGWVSMCYQAAGLGEIDGDANDMYWLYCHSSNREDIIPGMIIAVPSHSHSWAGQQWGHVGIIVEKDGQLYVRENVGYINEITLDEWITYYGTTYTPQWGFAADV